MFISAPALKRARINQLIFFTVTSSYCPTAIILQTTYCSKPCSCPKRCS